MGWVFRSLPKKDEGVKKVKIQRRANMKLSLSGMLKNYFRIVKSRKVKGE